MNTIKTISNARKVGGEHFRLCYSKTSPRHLSDYIGLFDPDDYYILKSSYIQRPVSYEEFIDFRHSRYIFLLKSKNNIDNILRWLEWIESIKGISFIDRPLPPFSPDKIIIRK